MAWQCLDCSNRSSRQFPGGKCPACGSFNIKSRGMRYAEPEKPRKTLLEIVMMVALWALLLYGFWDKVIA